MSQDHRIDRNRQRVGHLDNYVGVHVGGAEPIREHEHHPRDVAPPIGSVPSGLDDRLVHTAAQRFGLVGQLDCPLQLCEIAGRAGEALERLGETVDGDHHVLAKPFQQCRTDTGKVQQSPHHDAEAEVDQKDDFCRHASGSTWRCTFGGWPFDERDVLLDAVLIQFEGRLPQTIYGLLLLIHMQRNHDEVRFSPDNETRVFDRRLRVLPYGQRTDRDEARQESRRRFHGLSVSNPLFGTNSQLAKFNTGRRLARNTQLCVENRRRPHIEATRPHGRRTVRGLRGPECAPATETLALAPNRAQSSLNFEVAV